MAKRSDKKDRKRSKSRRRRRRDSDSDDSGSRSHSSSDSGSRSDRFPKWNPRDKEASKTRISSRQLGALEGLRFRRRSDLLAFVTKHPGVLTSHMMMQIRARLLHGAPEAMLDLYRVDAGVWAATAAGLKEVRDQREIAVVAKALTLLNQGKTAQASDLMVQRIREILVAKRPGGSWEKGELVSLLPSTQASSAPLPDGALAL